MSLIAVIIFISETKLRFVCIVVIYTLYIIVTHNYNVFVFCVQINNFYDSRNMYIWTSPVAFSMKYGIYSFIFWVDGNF